MNTRSLRTLLQIEKVGSFALAARQLNMTLAAVSMQMKVLEEELQVQLFDRSFRPPRFTAEGRSVLGRAEAVVDAEDALRDHCMPTDRLRGRFRIGFVGTASVRLLPAFLKRAGADAPDAAFDIETGTSAQLERRLANGQIDAAVVSASSGNPSGLRYDVLAEETLHFAVPARMRDRPLEDLFAGLQFLQFTPSSGVGRQIARHVAGFDSYDESRAILLDSVEAIMECVKQDIGFTLLPEPDIKRYADDGVHILSYDRKAPVRALVLATLVTAPERTARLLSDLFTS